jgi:histidine ammonia-lyase
MVEVGGRPLSAAEVARWGHRSGRITFAAGVAERLGDNAAMAERIAAESVSYGRTTGVGANRDVAADDSDGQHGLRLVRSHATAAGAPMGDEVARSMLLVRLQQLSQGGSGIPFEIVEALRAAATDGRVPVARSIGAMGTGDIAVLAELALSLLGERPWADGSTHGYLAHIGGNGALAFISSSAVTIAVAAHAAVELRRWLDASMVVSAMSTLAIMPNRQQWSEAVDRTRSSPGLSWATRTMRGLLDDGEWTAARTQDPMSFRSAPFVAGPLFEALEGLDEVLAAEINAAAENPRYEDDAVWHHGAFMLTRLALALDHARLAAVQWCATSTARLAKLLDPAYTGLGRFLAAGPAGSSGLMVLEYTAGSALETVRSLADASSRHSTVVSLGVEDHASMAGRAASAARELVVAARVATACELVAAVRALRAVPIDRLPDAIGDALDDAGDVSAEVEDHPLVDDIGSALSALDRLGL